MQQNTITKDSINRIQINEISLNKLHRKWLIGTSYTVCKVIVDEKHCETSHSQKSLTPICLVNERSIVRLEFYNSDWYNSKPLSYSNLIGTYEFTIKQITNFAGDSTGTLFISPNVKIAVSTRWKSDNKIDRREVKRLRPERGLRKFRLGREVRKTYPGWADYVDHNTKRTTYERLSAPAEPEGKSLAPCIVSYPLPPHWEARRAGESAVYLHNVHSGKSTACLWYDPLPIALRSSTTLTPMPKGWWQCSENGKLAFMKNGRLAFKENTVETSQTRPPHDVKSILNGVIKWKRFSQLHEFFPQTLVSQYEE
ncbi:hypothetical protein B0J14DRAFT_569158 [Halenospora varia]|nr:hypothetical protein B0J14DRAFT_569158 [Halenospora varia]